MSIRIRVVGGVMVALCAARSVSKPGDVYLDDAHHQALSTKFRADFRSEGHRSIEEEDPETARVRGAEESNNPNREWWDRTYGPLSWAAKAVRAIASTTCPRPQCGARPGQPCRTPGGQLIVNRCHAARAEP